MKYRVLLFDMDGMLVDTTEGVMDCFKHVLEVFGIPPMDQKGLDRFMGPPLTYSFINFCHLSEEDAAKAVLVYRERYTERGQYACKLFPGIRSLLEQLKAKGYRMCVATSKLESFARPIACRLGLTDFFEEVVGSNVEETISSKDEVIEEACRRMKITDRSEVLMIGDRKYDVLGAKKCGMDSFGIYMGCAEENEHEDAGATYIANGVEELTEKLLSF